MLTSKPTSGLWLLATIVFDGSRYSSVGTSPDWRAKASSAVGAFGMYTGNKTWVVMGFGALFLKEDTWRIKAAGGTGSINFQFYLKTPIDIWVPYNTAADFAFVGIDRRIWDDLFLGVSYTYTRFETTVDSIDAPGDEHGLLIGHGE